MAPGLSAIQNEINNSIDGLDRKLRAINLKVLRSHHSEPTSFDIFRSMKIQSWATRSIKLTITSLLSSVIKAST